MRRLYLRIFLSFWLAMVLILTGAIGVTATIAWYRLSRFEAADPGAMIAGAAAAARAGGRTSLARWQRDAVSQHREIDIYVVGPEGDDLLGRPIPNRIGQWLTLNAPAASSPSAEARPPYGYALAPHGVTPRRGGMNRSHLLANPTLKGSDGRDYRLVVAWFGATPRDVLGSNGTVGLLLLIAVAVSAGVCWWIARHISRPVAELQRSARSLALGNLGARVSPQVSARSDELGRLARDFDEMAERLRSQIASKEVLIRDISHELRSPLARLRVTLALAQQGAGDLPQQLERIERDIERLDSLIEDTLQFSRLSSSDPSFSQEEVDLDHMLKDVAADAGLEAVVADKTIAVRSAPGECIWANPLLLRRALDNVVRNAVRFAPKRSVVEIALQRTPSHAIVAVSDRGPGVPERDRERIFEAFYRVNEARDRISGGAGLGLAITARVMAVHGGTATARNLPGGGLVVELTLPTEKKTSRAVT